MQKKLKIVSVVSISSDITANAQGNVIILEQFSAQGDVFGNDASIIQEGDFNGAGVTVVGDGNYTEVTQVGLGNLAIGTIFGESNTFSVAQFGDEK